MNRHKRRLSEKQYPLNLLVDYSGIYILVQGNFVDIFQLSSVIFEVTVVNPLCYNVKENRKDLETPMLLQFNSNQQFKIVQFTDIHWHNGEEADRQSADLMKMVIQMEQPDLAILTGDILSGGGCQDAGESMRQIASIFEGYQQLWASVFGNHDDEGNTTRHQLMQIQTEYQMCLSQAGPDEITGVGNYVLPIGKSQKHQTVQTSEPAALLYFIDSGSYAPTEIGGYDWVRRDQIEWYIHRSTEFRQKIGHPLPALAFFHIPIPEYDEVWDFHTCYGIKYEAVCPPRVNTGLFAAMHEMEDVVGTFVGHDHVNDYFGDLHGIRLCYGRATVYNTYGRDRFLRGARVIRLREDERQFQTWLRLSDGSLVSEQPEHRPLERQLTTDVDPAN